MTDRNKIPAFSKLPWLLVRTTGVNGRLRCRLGGWGGITKEVEAGGEWGSGWEDHRGEGWWGVRGMRQVPLLSMTLQQRPHWTAV